MDQSHSSSFKPYRRDRLNEELDKNDHIGSSQQITLAPGLDLYYSEHVFQKDISLRTEYTLKDPVLVLTVGLEGRSGYQDDSGQTMEFRENTTSVALLYKSSGYRQFFADKPMVQIRLVVYRSWFSDHLGEELASHLYDSQQSLKLWMQKKTSLFTRTTCERVAGLSFEKPFDLLEIHSLMMSVLKTEADDLMRRILFQSEEEVVFTERDRTQILKAKSYMQDRCDQPLTVRQVSRAVGMNEHKFKQAMLHFFGKPPFQLLTEIRMCKAHELLLSESLSIAQVAAKVGYQHSSNFSKAFKKFFSVSPGLLRKKKTSLPPSHG